MAECPGGRTTRGTRSQFRLGLPGLGQGRGFYPIHFGDIMESGQSPQTGILSSRDMVSPTKGTRTRTVREYEQTISELNKENFDLKLKLFMCNEAMKRNSQKDGNSPTKDPIEVIVKLNSETESLQNELQSKDKLLQDALERAEKCEIDFKELEKKYAELQLELSSLSELPSKEEYLSLLAEKENLIHHTESLEEALTEKEEEIHDVNQKIEILANQNRILEEKIQKRSLAIQGFVYKSYKEKEMLPDELRNVVISATKAAKNKNKDDLAIAIKTISATLNKIMCSVQTLNQSEEKENIQSPQAKCLKEEFLDKSSSFLPSQNESRTELSHIQSLKEVLAERNSPGITDVNSLDSSVHMSYVKGNSHVNIAERDVIDYVNTSAMHSVQADNLVSFSHSHSPQSCSIHERSTTNIETLSVPSLSSDVVHEKEELSRSNVISHSNRSSAESGQMIDVLRENQNLKLEIKEKLAVIQDLRATCKELELKKVHLKEIDEDALKASKQFSVHIQTDITGCNLINEYEMVKLQKDAKLSDSVEELREDVLRLLLAMEDKNNELMDVRQSLSEVQEDLKKALNTTNIIDKDYYMNERNELHERLALSCSVNEELLKHLKNLEAFMENLLQNKFNSSIESMSEKSDFIFNVSRCLNESLKLSNILSDHLSVCEGSKLFEECESLLYKNGSYFEEKSFPNVDSSQLNIPERSSYPGTHIREDFVPFVRKNDMRMSREHDSSQLCWQSWQQQNAPMKNAEISHEIVNDVVHRNIGYPSSESDIWSEPDRNISMQRIGISLQNSPVSSKSPRKLRLKEKRIRSSDQDTSSSESQRLSKKRHGSASRRLFSKENIKNQDFTSEKFYFLLAEKFSKLKLLLDELENVKDGKLSAEVWVRLNAVMASLGEALQKLHIAKESAKNFPSAICGKCVMLELFAELKVSHKEADFYIDDTSSCEQEILQQFVGEINLLKEACKEPFSFFSEIIDKRCQSTQSVSLSENEDGKISELENVVVDLNDKNKELSEDLVEVKRLLSIEKEVLESVKIENLNLSKQITHLKNELCDLEQKKDELSVRNEELKMELTSVSQNNSDLNNTLKELEEKQKESSMELDQLTAELQKNKSDLYNMNARCLEYEKQLNQQISRKEECENKFKNLECASLNDKKKYLNQINDLNAEKNYFVKELETVQEKLCALEKETAILNNELNSKDSELACLQKSLKKVEEDKEMLNANCAELEKELENKNEHATNLQKKCNSFDEVLAKYKVNEAEYCQQLKQQEEKSLSEKQRLMSEISMLTNEREEIMQKLKEEKECYDKLMKQKVELNQNYVESCQQISHFKLLNEELKNELENKNEQVTDLQKKCSSHDEVLAKYKVNEAEHCRQLKQLEEKSLSEKQRLMSEISMLTNEREEILQKLKDEKECYDNLMKEKIELSQNYVESCQQISQFKLLNEELKNKELNIIQKSEFYEKALNSSNSECSILNQECKCLRETLQSLESKCLVYEKELVAAAGMKDTFVECLLKINNEFSFQRQKLNEICKAYRNENSVLRDETSDFIPVIDEDNVQRLCENLNAESEKLLQSVGMLVDILKNFHRKSLDSKTSEVKHKANIKNQIEFYVAEIEHLKTQNNQLQRALDESKTSEEKHEVGIKNQTHFHKAKIEHLKSQNDNLQRINDELRTDWEEKYAKSINKLREFHKAETAHLQSKNDNNQRTIDELQKLVSEKEKSVQFSAYEIQSLKEKLQNKKNEIEKENRLLKRKDDEIILLQERIFNLQMDLSSSLSNKSDLQDKTTSIGCKSLDSIIDSVSSDNQLPSQSCLMVSKMCQTNEYEDPSQSADDSFSSTSTLDTSKNSCCEKYWKRCYSLQTKLALRKKHIEILEKEKNDLKECYLQQLQDKQDSSGRRNSDSLKITELESVLEKKKTFIQELKAELLKTCNSLINKEQEIDDLKQKNSEYESKSKTVISDTQDSHSILTNAVDTNIKTLKNYKWRLIQTIFDIQKRFYTKKGIHENYFEKFKHHVNNLYSMQLTQSFSKSESMPLLGSHAGKLQCDENDKVKTVAGLEFDIECLENLKIFLDRFLVPCVLEKSQTDVKSADFEEQRKRISSDSSTLQAEVEKSKSSKPQATDILNISFPDTFTFHLSSDKDLSQENSFSFENFASNVSHHLDCIENFFTAVRECQLEDFDASTKECIDKAEVKSLLLKIFQEIRILHEESVKLFDLNLLLKSFDFIIAQPPPLISNRPDTSDRESLLSEETIAVSRSESPLSFEDVCPIKLPRPEMLKLEEKTLKPESLGNRLSVTEPYGTKMTAIGSSCDSVCQRSHYSSPDLGIESDPNHDSSAPEQKEDGLVSFQRHIIEGQKSVVKTQQKTAFTSTESAGRWSGHRFGDMLYAIGNLQDYELLKKEIKESLVAIKSVLSRTGDGLHHIAKYTSPRKTLEYNTLKSIKDTCVHMEVCLKRAHELGGKFWTAPCPTEKEWKFLNDENLSLSEQLVRIKALFQKQDSEFKKAMGKLEHAEVVKANMEKKISKKLVKTKKVIRQAELKLLENRCQNFPPVPKYPSNQAEQPPQANLLQEM